MKIPCVVIRDRKPETSRKDLLDTGADDLFVIDFDALAGSKLNYHVYTDLAKYFEIIVLNFPTKPIEFLDTIIAGASGVVIPDYVPDRIMEEFLSYSSEVVLNDRNPEKSATFVSLGGDMFLSEHIVQSPHRTVYSYGRREEPGYIMLDNFPFDMISRFL